MQILNPQTCSGETPRAGGSGPLKISFVRPELVGHRVAVAWMGGLGGCPSGAISPPPPSPVTRAETFQGGVRLEEELTHFPVPFSLLPAELHGGDGMGFNSGDNGRLSTADM